MKTSKGEKGKTPRSTDNGDPRRSDNESPSSSAENPEKASKSAEGDKTCDELEHQKVEDGEENSINSDDDSDEPEDAVLRPGAVAVRGIDWSPQDDEFSIEVHNDDSAANSSIVLDLPLLEGEIAPNEQDIENRIRTQASFKKEIELERRIQERVVAANTVHVLSEVDENDGNDENDKTPMNRTIFFVVAVLVVGIGLGVGLGLNNSSQPQPALIPSLQPSTSSLPSMAPTSLRSKAPTMIESMAPTMAPSMAPSLSPSVSMAPTTVQYGIIRSMLENYLNDTTFPSSELQEIGLEWLANQDELNPLLQSEPDYLLDRLVMVILYFATSGTTWTSRNDWLSNVSTCDWEHIICDANGRIQRVELCK